VSRSLPQNVIAHRFGVVVVYVGLLLALTFTTRTPVAGQNPVSTPVTVDALNPIPINSLFDLPFLWTGALYPQPQNYVSLVVTFVSPSGTTQSVIGVYEPPSLWRVIFFPGEMGLWSWYGIFTDGITLQEYRGTFTVVDAPTPIPRPSPAPSIVFDPNSIQTRTVRDDMRTATREAALEQITPTPTGAELINLSVPAYSVIEIPFTWRSGVYTNPHEDVVVSAVFTSPDGRSYNIGGFHYAANDYRVRFAPTVVGEWVWNVRIGDGTQNRDYSGTFTVTESSSAGFVRQNPANPMRWVFDNGEPFYPVGLGDCILDRDEDDTPFNEMGMDGPLRPPVGERITEQDRTGNRVDMETYLQTYGAAGFNLFRVSQNNCAFGLFGRISPEGNTYRLREGRWGDELLRMLRENGFRVYMVLFSFSPPYPNGAENPEEMAAIHRAVEYIVNRYGAYVDFWELMNESRAPSDAWYRSVVEHIRRIDPYQHPISTSWERPDLPFIDITSPHWYERESALESDLRTVQEIARYTSFGKPIIFGEQGNTGQNWDVTSARRMRIRLWTAFFNEAVFIFWNTSHAMDYLHPSAANIYLGAEERAYVRVLQDFTQMVDQDAVIQSVRVSHPELARAYALQSPSMAAAYIVAALDQTNPTRDLTITLNVPVTGAAVWITPATGEVIGLETVTAGIQTLVVPDFTIDAALMIR